MHDGQRVRTARSLRDGIPCWRRTGRWRAGGGHHGRWPPSADRGARATRAPRPSVGPRVTPLQSSDALRRAAPGGPVPRHLAPAGVIILRTAGDGSRTGDLDVLEGCGRRKARGAFHSCRPAEVHVFNSAPSLTLPCDSVKHQHIMHLALTIVCEFCLPYVLACLGSFFK